jgi:hypothetical protein
VNGFARCSVLTRHTRRHLLAYVSAGGRRGMPCLLPQSAEREPNRKSLRPNSNRATKENSVPPLGAGSFLPI